jgi:hypothetical protein
LGNRSGSAASPQLITPSQILADAGGVAAASFSGIGVLNQALTVITFVANLSGTTLTYVSGSVPTVGAIISNTVGVPNGTTIQSGTSPTFVLSGSVTSGSSVTVTASGPGITFSTISTTTSSAANSLIKTGSDSSVAVQSLNISTYPLITLDGTTVKFWTPGSPPTGVGSPAVITPFMSTVGTTSITTTFNGTVDIASGTLITRTLKTNSTDNAITGDIQGTWKVLSGSSIDFYTNSATLQTGIITTGAVGNNGQITGNWSLSTGSKLQATYADLAEYYEGDQEYEAGTVLVFGGDKEVTTTSTINDTRSAGVVTTNPAYVMNSEQTGIKVCIALAGRVPVKVIGRVKKGDMLTTSATPGYAVKALSPTLGAVIGKALEDKDYGEAGVIQVAVGRV